jgi:diguanylate cyclase (GGDEF)-like protein
MASNMITQIMDSSTVDITNALILLVDDDKLNTLITAKSLEQFRNVKAVHSGAKAITFCKETPPDLVLLDVVMPGLDGHATCRVLRTLEGMENCPIIFSTSLESVEDEINCWDAGGTDFVSKPVSPATLQKRIQSHLRLKLKSDKQNALAAFDSLTGLRNRRFFDDYYQEQLRLGRRNKTDLAVAVIGIDNFKQYNDYYGQAQGDLCLKFVAKIITEQLHRPTDVAVRYDGEEFVLVLPNTDIEGARFIASNIMSQFEKQATPHAQSSLKKITLSAGLASLGSTDSDADLFSVAEQRLYSVKNAGRNACT